MGSTAPFGSGPNDSSIGEEIHSIAQAVARMRATTERAGSTLYGKERGAAMLHPLPALGLDGLRVRLSFVDVGGAAMAVDLDVLSTLPSVTKASRLSATTAAEPWLGSVPTEQDGLRSVWPAAGQETSPSRGTTIPASFSKYSGGLIRLYGSRLVPSRLRAGSGLRCGVGEVADELRERVAGELEVGLDDSCVRAGLAVDRTGKPHHPASLRARGVGQVRLAVGADAEVVDDPQVRALDRLDQLAGPLDHAGGLKRFGELEVGMGTAAPGALDE
jgi:hypothetical protein